MVDALPRSSICKPRTRNGGAPFASRRRAIPCVILGNMTDRFQPAFDFPGNGITSIGTSGATIGAASVMNVAMY